MIFHSRHTITIGQLAILMDSHDYNLIRRIRIPIPKKLLKRAFWRLMKEVHETLNHSELEKEIESWILKTRLFNRAFNLYPAIVDIVSITWDKEHLNMIEELTGCRLTTLADREMLIVEMKRLQDKYSELMSVPVNEKEGVSFSKVIVSTEIVLNIAIPRTIKLFEFQYYMEQASDKIRQLQKRA